MLAVFIVLVIVAIMAFYVCRSIEPFTPEYTQIYPLTGNAPLTVAFVPVYVNYFIPFQVSFGDGDTYTGTSSAPFAHTYMMSGVYAGEIIYDSVRLHNPIRRTFRVTVK
jgi:hypothetical protein